ncbi:MAG: ShlB/FhaC/HecB family hemolysin secretion/activation protein [Acidobacteriota bacterium]
MVRAIPLTLCVALAHAAVPAAWAAPVEAPAVAPGAGDVLRDTTPPAPRPAMPAESSAPAVAPSAPAATTGLSFVLKSLQLKGSSALSPEQQRAVIAPYVGQAVADQELGQIIAALRRAYEQQGLGLVGLGFPAQDVSSGVLTIEVVEPRLGRIQTPLSRNAPISAERVQGLLRFFNVKEGQLLNVRDLDRALFALNDLPGVQAKGSMTPAGDEGAYNLTITVQARRAWDAAVTLDNQGSSFTGVWRAGASVRWNNPLSLGDNLDLRTLWSSGGGVKVGRLAYETPVAYTPVRWSIGTSQVDYDLRGAFADLSAHGSARVVDTGLSYPLIRSRVQTLVGRVGYESKTLTDRLDIIDYREDKQVRSWSAGLSYEGRDAFLGGGYVGAMLQWRNGHLSLKEPDALAADQLLGNRATNGVFNKWEGQLSRLQALTREWSVYGAVSRQWASRNLDTAEKMALGGPNGVRAYAASEGASDQATLLTAELRWWLNANWTVFALYDWARGERERRPDTTEGNGLILRGAGLGLSMSYPGWAAVKATLAWRGHQAPVSDSRDDRPRLFLSAQHTF